MTKKNTAVSNEEIIAALLASGTVREAAAKTGLTPRTICERMNNRDFKAAYISAKTDIVRQAVLSINRSLSTAIDTVISIMNNQSVNAAIRLQAAQTILNNASKFAERLVADERCICEHVKNPFSFDFLEEK